jgi:hypothetical protein
MNDNRVEDDSSPGGESSEEDQSSSETNNNNKEEENNGINQRIKEELALSAIHRKHVESHWRQVLRKEKFQELRNDVGSLQQYHTQNIQRKKDIIRCIQDETANLQKLYHGAMVANINHMENMIAIHDEQVILLEKSFQERLASMQSEFEQDVELITTQYEHEKEIVQQCIDRHDEKEQRRKSMLQMEQDRELDEIKARHMDNDVRIKRNVDLAVKNFQEQFEQTHEEYSRRNHVTRKIYEELKLKDDEVKQKISETTRRADHIRSKVQRIQLLAQKEKHQRQEQHQILLERKTRALETFQLIKDDMTKFRKNEQEKLVALSLRANERKESLQKQCEVAERVKKIADRCRQLETSREQFASMLRELSSPPQPQQQEEPHDDEDDDDDEQQDDSNDVRNEASKLVAEQKKAASKSVALTSFGDATTTTTQERTLLWDTTARFWDKYNLAQVDVLRLQKRIVELKQKEQELQNKLTIATNGVTVNDDVMKERNPLLVINGKMNTLIPSQEKKKKRLTVVEGNHFLRDTTIQRGR